MSREVDERVVEMRFDNAQFEKGTRETMNTLDRLQQKLQFKDVDKGFEAIDQAQRNVDFDEMGGALDAISVKFNALDVMAVSALSNITNKIVDTGEKLVKSLSVDQVMSGWNKYTEKSASIQTIMNATGKSLDQVNGYLNKLMWFSDETSYGFTDMTSALATLTSSGGDIEKLIPMIEGIANATAYAGKGATEFSRAIFNLAQSYGTGSLQLIDWKSVAQAGVGSEQLKQILIETGEELGTLQKGAVTVGTFENSLQKKWATQKVMEKGFAKFASLTEAAYQAVQAGEYDTASEAIEALADSYDDVAVKAFKSAQEAKSFAEAIDATKDAVSSSWMKLFENIFGNKEEATATWTELANRLYDIFVPPIEDLSDRVKDGLDSGWTQLLQNELGDQADAYSYVMEKVALASGAITQKQIDEAGSFSDAIKLGGINAELLKKGMEEAQKSAEKMLTLSDSELEKRGTTREEIEKNAQAFENLNEKIQNGTLDLDAYAKKIREISGREHLTQSLWNLMDAISALVKPIHEAFRDIFPSKTGEEIKSFAQWLDSTTKKLIISDETANKIRTAAEGIFSVLRVGKDVLSGLISGATQILTLTKPLADIFLDATSAAGKLASEIAKGLHPLNTISDFVTNFVNAAAPALYSFGSTLDKILTSIAHGVKDTFNEFNPEKLNQFIMGGMGASMLVSVKGFLESIRSIGSSAKGVVNGIKDCIESLGEAVDAWKSAKKAETLMTIAKAVALIAGSLAILSMVKPERLGRSLGALTVAFGELLGVMTLMTKITKNVQSLKLSILAGGMIAVSAAVLVLSSALKLISAIDSDKLLGSVLALGEVMVELAAVAAVLSKNGGRFTKGASGMIAFAAGIRILVSSVTALGKLKTDALAKGIISVGVLCAELVATAKLMSDTKFGIGKGTGLVLMAASIEILQNAVAKFGELDSDAVKQGLLAIAGGLAEFVIALKLTKGTVGSAVSLTIMAGAVNLLVPAFRGLGELSLQTIGTALLAVAGAFVVLGGAAVILSPVTPVIVALSLSLSALALSLGALLALNSASMFIGNLASSLSLLNSLNFQVFLNGIKALAWTFVEFVAGVFEGIGEIASSLVTSIVKIITAICNAIIQAAPVIGQALYVLGTTVIDTVVSLTAYVWEKIEPALNDLWEKFTGWAANHNPLDPSNWGGQTKGISANAFVLPFTDIIDELKNGDSVTAGFYQAFTEIGKNVSEGIKQGQLDGKKDATDAAEETANAVIDTSKNTFKSHSPSRVMAELGRYVTLGLAEGIADPSALAQTKTAMLNVASSIRNVFTTFWGIHSPSDLAASDAENIIEGALLGIGDKSNQEELRQASYSGALVMKDGFIQAIDETTIAVREKLDGLYDAFKQSSLHLGNKVYQNDLIKAQNEYADAVQDNILIPGKTGIKYSGSTRNATQKELRDAKQASADAQSALNDPYGILADWIQKTKDSINDLTGNTGGGTKKTSGSSKTQKTAAENLADEYTKKLKSNKAKMDEANKEYSLWETETGDTASAEEFIRKKTESLTTEITNQTDRVAIAKEQYDKMVQEATATEDQKNEAYSTWLDESQTLAELKREKQNSIFKAIKERYDDEASTATDEYELWSALYEDTATVEEKSNKKIQNINRKLTAQAKVVTAAEDAYTELKAEFGEKSLKTQEAYRQLLEAQTDYAELNNDLNQAQLDAFDEALALMEKHEKLVTNRQNMLAKIYDDGDLSQREEAYKNAVEQYGADSAEARKAATQGTMRSIIAVGTALNSMSFSLKKNTNKQDKYNQAVKEFGKDSAEALEALADLQDEQYSFVGFAENLADAFEMDDSGKKMMMQLGYAVSRNWKPIQNGFQQVWQKVQQNFPQIADKMANAFGVATSEGFTNVATDLFSVITSLVSGDWGTALTSGIAAVVDFMGSDFGQNLMQNLAPLVTALPEAFTTLAKGGKTLTVMGKSVTVAAESVGELGASSLALLGDGGIFASIGGAFVKLAAALGPEGWLVLAISAGVLVLGGLIFKNWDKVTEFFEGFAEWMHGVFSNIWDGIKNTAKGVGDFFKGAWNKASEAVGNVVETGKNFVQGFAEGVANAASTAWNGVKDFCGGVLDSVKSFFGIHSPSTVMAEMGGYVSTGFANGVADSSTAVDKSMSSLMQSAMDAATLSAEMIQSVFDSDAMDYEPTIRPVVDLDGAQESAQWLQSAFADANGTYGAAGTAYTGHLAGTIAERRPKNQNGAETVREPQTSKEVLEAIDAIGERVDDLSEAIRNMKLSINGRKLVGEIISDVDTQLNTLAKRSRR